MDIGARKQLLYHTSFVNVNFEMKIDEQSEMLTNLR